MNHGFVKYDEGDIFSKSIHPQQMKCELWYQLVHLMKKINILDPYISLLYAYHWMQRSLIRVLC